MAAPHGDTLKNLNAGFTEFTTPQTFRDAQDGFGGDADCTSGTLHASLEPSILSIFEDTSPAEVAKSRIDEESEAMLLSALSEILDTVMEETLSPFDSLPDSDLLLGQTSQDLKLNSLEVSNRETSRVTRSQRSSPSPSKADSLCTDRQLRPRLHQKIQKATVLRSDGEEENLSEARKHPVRIFRLESDSSEEQQDGHAHVSLPDLVRHMHPYSVRVDLSEEERTKKVRDLQEEDVFVDVEGDDELEADVTPVSQSDLDLEKKALPPPVANADSECDADQKEGISMEQLKEETLERSSSKDDVDNTKMLERNVLAGRVKKKVTFAPNLASFLEYQPYDEESEGDSSDEVSSEDQKDDLVALGDNSVKEPNEELSLHGKTKPKSISLQEYRLLRQKTLPKEDRKTDHKTKWPSVPVPPTELPPILCIPGCSPPQGKTSSLDSRTSVPGSVSRTDMSLPPKSPPKQSTTIRTPMQSIDPPNPAIVPLPALVPPEVQKVKQQKSEAHKPPVSHPTHMPPSALQSSRVLKQPGSLAQETQIPDLDLAGSPVVEVRLSEDTPSITNASKTARSALSLPSMTGRRALPSQSKLPPVQIPTPANEVRCAEQQSPGSEDVGIEASDVTSLLEQFETQGLTPPATPPHQIWKPLVPGQRPKQHETIKPSPSKAIQIIEPRPLPPSKLHSRPQPTTSTPAPSLYLATVDHDYCRTQELKHSNKSVSPGVDMKQNSQEARDFRSPKPLDHRTFCEAERLSGSVLLSPESSPCRLETSGTGTDEEPSEPRGRRPLRCSSRSLSPPARGRTRRRRYRGQYHHSDSSSVSSSRSPSCSSSASSSTSRSPPRKRRRSQSSESGSNSSSCSSSCSMSPSPVRRRRHRYHRSSSRSFSRSSSRSCSRSRSRSRSRSPHAKWNQRWIRQREHYRPSRWVEDAHKSRKQKAIEERRVVYVGRIRGTMTQDELRERFALFGKIEDCTVHFRKHGDNYGFVTYYNTDDAFAAIENGGKLRQPDELPFDICFGGRRQFCQMNYADLDSNRDIDPDLVKNKCKGLDFDTLLKQAQREVRR